MRPTSNEVSLNLEREITTGLSGRASWVYKNMRNVWGEIDVVRAAGYTVPFTINDPGADRVVGTADDQTFQTQALAAGDRHAIASSPTSASAGNADFQTMEFALNRRFSGKWMMLDLVRLHLVDDGAYHRAAPRPRQDHVHLSPVRSACWATMASRPLRCGTTRSSAAT